MISSTNSVKSRNEVFSFCTFFLCIFLAVKLRCFACCWRMFLRTKMARTLHFSSHERHMTFEVEMGGKEESGKPMVQRKSRVGWLYIIIEHIESSMDGCFKKKYSVVWHHCISALSYPKKDIQRKFPFLHQHDTSTERSGWNRKIEVWSMKARHWGCKPFYPTDSVVYPVVYRYSRDYLLRQYIVLLIVFF